MKFEIVGMRPNGETKIYTYDNIENVLTSDLGEIVEDKTRSLPKMRESLPFSPKDPLKKSKDVDILKIQLGLSCNYSCEYCSQRFVEKADETSFKELDGFLAKLENLDFSENIGLKIEFWGGEPFVYWKTLKPLVAALKLKFETWTKKPRYSVITNGSILTEEIIEWLLDNMDGMAISHDGPGQHVRGPDPFLDEDHRELVLKLYNTVKSKSRNLKAMSFNSMLNAKNYKRREIRDWFVNFTNDDTVQIGEGSFIDAYDEGAIGLSLLTKQQHFEYRKTTFADIFQVPDEVDVGWPNVVTKINSFVKSLLQHHNAKYVGQKCGMDLENTISVDLRGDVLTCQNVSGVSINANDQPHLSGNITDIDAVRITSSTHWSKREECPRCPVLHICKGSCMFASNEYWEHSCNNSYSDSIVIFALAFEKLTGYIPMLIDNDYLPDYRRDIFGTMMKHDEGDIVKKKKSMKPFPIKVVTNN